MLGLKGRRDSLGGRLAPLWNQRVPSIERIPLPGVPPGLQYICHECVSECAGEWHAEPVWCSAPIETNAEHRRFALSMGLELKRWWPAPDLPEHDLAGIAYAYRYMQLRRPMALAELCALTGATLAKRRRPDGSVETYSRPADAPGDSQ